MHSNGDRASDQALRVYRRLFEENTDQLGVGVSHTIGHVYYWGQTFRDYVLGLPRALRIDPVAENVHYGATYSFHSDSPVTEVDPLLWVDTAMARTLFQEPNHVPGKD
ncbi:hypothetical protein GJ744_001991 [Endocarpon pusillum]|uniref:Uncharacterized protein n=1 Tax=Endocarpon pusillum TaxID=364733 RepID=A0A8H7ACJ1_9EURO|nr:hypothetical protein GJ744_001991 [Endocarpon pusillum]